MFKYGNYFLEFAGIKTILFIYRI
ncbi:Hypothetical protein CFV354_1804 [Campylobacter fetus subsp. venerealis NCTC 10354]|nr:Hypothetical protein CFV354_1804 [Campylobacter fetus subsp. venerealis NCTC 10354]